MPFTCSKRKFRAALRTATKLQPLTARQKEKLRGAFRSWSQ
ncbi:hypothetical protein [Pilibacter termitis]|nr:hypothetical protein [Pilibacter termitis]